ncbi:sperm associated antigen 17 [Perkinsus olseni]|uniref:Sperm associated antigen 17 n=1 Tax=Perkinsus olseni TaxID=32597 RepID=A0A7J6PI84_PEROL|nr:sperm associated antigen 17 [Perkinsus olseni]
MFQKLEVVGSREERAAFARRSPWDPLLPHEWAKMEELIEQKRQKEEKSMESAAAVVEKSDQVKDSGEQLRRETADEALPSEREGEDENYSHKESAKTLTGIIPEGPHPDKRGSQWDVYGDPRVDEGSSEDACLVRNGEFVSIEAPVHRRIRTSSLARKMEGVEAPGAMEIRKSGSHTGVIERYLHATGIAHDGDGTQTELLTASLLGLGDPGKLIEVSPVRLVFGCVRQYGIYRMVVKVRNLDSDVTRLKVKIVGNIPSKEAIVRPMYRPGPLPPGLATNIGVELIAREPCKVEVILQIASKGQIAQIPVLGEVVGDAVSGRDYNYLPTGSIKVSSYRCVRDGYGPVEPWGDVVVSLADEK